MSKLWRQLQTTVPTAGSLLCVLVCNLLATQALADVTLPNIFCDHMVLQRDQPIPVWGTAAPGESITVTLSSTEEPLDSSTLKVVANAHGKWSAKLPAKKASDRPMKLVVAASNTIRFMDILIGDVWLCSGQSNMHWPLKLSDSASEIESAALPNVRLLNLQANAYPSGHAFTPQELESCQSDRFLSGKWSSCSPATAGDFSAIGYLFGREMLQRTKVPIGLIHNAVGGTPIESWISRDALQNDPTTRPLLSDWRTNELVHSFCRDRAAANLREVSDATAQTQQHPYHPGFMFEAGIVPLAPYGIRGVIWYQGESNAHNPKLHDVLFPMKIAEWRRIWDQGDFPFLFVQLPNLETTQWQAFRASQSRAQKLANVGMAVSIDVGNPSDVHPRNKHEVAHRLALLARAIAYGENIESSGPVVTSGERSGTGLRLNFSHTTGGLSLSNPTEAVFEVAGSDGVFFPANCKIEGDQILLDSSAVASPAVVRFAYQPNPRCSLYNSAGLPASPFEALVK